MKFLKRRKSDILKSILSFLRKRQCHLLSICETCFVWKYSHCRKETSPSGPLSMIFWQGWGARFQGKKDPNFQIDIAFLESSSDCLEMLSCLQEQQGGGLPPRAQASQARGVGSLLSNIWNKRRQASWCKIIPGILVLLNVNYKMWISVSNGLFCWLQNRGGFLLPLPICTLHLECGGVLLDKNKILGLAG